MSPATLWMPRAIIRDLTQQAMVNPTVETGGILLGYIAEATRDTVVLDALGPGPSAAGTPYAFEPDQQWQEQQLASRYHASNGLMGYVGDWHTHPNGPTAPSDRDRETLRRIARYRPARLRRPSMVIIALGDDTVSLGAWRREPAQFGLGCRCAHVIPMTIHVTTEGAGSAGLGCTGER